MTNITTTPLEALAELTAIAGLIDTFECKDNGLYNRLQGAIAVADSVLRLNVALLAMAPKQEAQEPVAEVSAMPGTSGFTMAVFKADDMPIGSKVYAVPAAANGALTDEQIKEICESTGWIPEWNDRDHIKFARAILAAAGPDAALVEAARHVVTCFNDPHTSLAYVQRWVNELAEVLALSGAKGN